METKAFNEVLSIWQKGNMRWTKELADKYNYVSEEALRQAFKKERKKRGIDKTSVTSSVTPPVIGILDIETLPVVAFVWELFNVNISTEQVLFETCLLSWAGKFLNATEVYLDILTPQEAITRNMERIVTSCWNFMKQCDIIVGHNFSSFDGKLMNMFFMKFNLPPLKYITVDTLQIARNNFRFSSNKMSFINQQLGIKEKIHNEGFPLWKKCHEGNPEALAKMKDYNIGDVYATEELFYKIRPYVKNINFALYNEVVEEQCPVCGSKDLITTGGVYPTTAGMWEEVRCNNCQTLTRRKQNLLSVEKKKSLLINS